MTEGLRLKNQKWTLTKHGNQYSYEAANLAVLMDLRDELQKLNNLLHCANFIGIPRTLDRIAKNTTKPRKRVRK